MGSLGCPLCCSQDFMSVVALHDHLLYFIYRPLKCPICNSHIEGIQGLTHHLQWHMMEGTRTVTSGGAPTSPQITYRTRSEFTALGTVVPIFFFFYCTVLLFWYVNHQVSKYKERICWTHRYVMKILAFTESQYMKYWMFSQNCEHVVVNSSSTLI